MVALMGKSKTREQLAPTAYHEAGHTVAAVFLYIGLKHKGVTIVPNRVRGVLGETHVKKGFRGKPYLVNRAVVWRGLEKQIIISLAGEHAQRKYRPSSVRSHDIADDRREAVKWLSYLALDATGEPISEELRLHYKLLNLRAKNMVATRWPEITAVANALLERKTLTAQEVREVLFPEFHRR